MPARPPRWRETASILSAVGFSFIAYLAIGLPLAVLPGYVYADLGYSAMVAGLAISAQYIATLVSRPYAGRLSDAIGPKRTVIYGMAFTSLSGLLLLLTGLLATTPALALAALLLSRLVLGVGESLAAIGAMAWAIRLIGLEQTGRVISWNGIATYGALALGAPLGVALQQAAGLWAVGAIVALICGFGFWAARRKAGVPVLPTRPLVFRKILWRVLPHGLGMAMGTIGFGVIATFITLYYASRGWSNPALTLTAFGLCFIGARLCLGDAIGRHGGLRVATVSLTVECAGLLILWLASAPVVALLGAALAAIGFALVFPALGVEAVKRVPTDNRGSALGAYAVFADVSLGITGPLAGWIIGRSGYPAIFLFAACMALAALALTRLLVYRARRESGR